MVWCAAIDRERNGPGGHISGRGVTVTPPLLELHIIRPYLPVCSQYGYTNA